MNKLNTVAMLSPVLVFCLSEAASGQMKERSEIAEVYQWKLEDLYPSDQVWEQAKEELAGRLDAIGEYRGRLNDAAALRACLELDSDISKTFGRLYSYASMKSDQDTRVSRYLAMKQAVEIGRAHV